IELWVVDAQSGSARKLDGVVLNAVSGAAFQWMPDSRTLLCRTVPEKRGASPVAPMTPTGPNIQESYGKSAPVRTYQDLLKNAHDDALFEYYAASQLVLIDTASGRKENLASAELYSSVDPAPNGEYFLVSIFRKPFSRLLPLYGFANDVLIWNRKGNIVHKLATLPSEED